MLKHVEPSYCKFERPSENMYFYVGTPQNLYLSLFMPRLHSTYDVILDSFQARKWLTTNEKKLTVRFVRRITLLINERIQGQCQLAVVLFLTPSFDV